MKNGTKIFFTLLLSGVLIFLVATQYFVTDEKNQSTDEILSPLGNEVSTSEVSVNELYEQEDVSFIESSQTNLIEKQVLKKDIPKVDTNLVSHKKERLNDDYEKDVQYVYYEGQRVPLADPNTFETLSGFYAKDANRVFYADRIIEGADLASFTVFEKGNQYAKDNKHAYANGYVIEEAEAATFEVIGYAFAKDAYTLFNLSTPVVLDIDIHFPSLKLISPGFKGTGVVLKDKDKVFSYVESYDNKKGWSKIVSVIDYIDEETFEYIGDCSVGELSGASYFKDKNHIYIGTELVPDIDRATFEYFGNYMVPEGMAYGAAYAADATSVYFGCAKAVPDADRKTFINLGDGYAKDKNSVWYLGSKTEADAETFEVIGGAAIGRDANFVYTYGSAFPHVSPTECLPGEAATCCALLQERNHYCSLE